MLTICRLFLDVECGALQPISNGRVELLNNRTTFNATAQYVCNENYTLKGDALRHCNSDGRWSGDVPSCLCNYPTTFGHFGGCHRSPLFRDAVAENKYSMRRAHHTMYLNPRDLNIDRCDLLIFLFDYGSVYESYHSAMWFFSFMRHRRAPKTSRLTNVIIPTCSDAFCPE